MARWTASTAPQVVVAEAGDRLYAASRDLLGQARAGGSLMEEAAARLPGRLGERVRFGFRASVTNPRRIASKMARPPPVLTAQLIERKLTGNTCWRIFDNTAAGAAAPNALTAKRMAASGPIRP